MPSRILRIPFLASIATVLAGCTGTPLFDAMPYADWRTLGAKPQFTLVEEAGHTTLTGRGPIPSNGFLASPREVGDFRLSVDVRIGSADNPTGEKMNSGIQIRSREMDGTVGGLQIEIDPSPRAWSGGVYDERGRAWLAPLEGNDAARAAFRLGEWNRYEIECVGPRVRTRINGVDCAEWYDAVVSGLLAFQVHGGPACEVAFRDPDFTDLGRHAWRAAPATPGASSGERVAWSCELDASTRGVRATVSGSARVDLIDAKGASVCSVSLEGPAAASLALVWIDGAGAALVDGRRVAAFTVADPPMRARIVGDSAEARDPQLLARD